MHVSPFNRPLIFERKIIYTVQQIFWFLKHLCASGRISKKICVKGVRSSKSLWKTREMGKLVLMVVPFCLAPLPFTCPCLYSPLLPFRLLRTGSLGLSLAHKRYSPWGEVTRDSGLQQWLDPSPSGTKIFQPLIHYGSLIQMACASNQWVFVGQREKGEEFIH